MPPPNQAALDFLLKRRSRPAKTLTTPVPGKAVIATLLTAAARTPDHGKLEPWRFIVLSKPALTRLARMVPERGAALGIEPDKITKAQAQYANADLAIAVISAPKPSDKIPQIEQIYSAGAVCLALVNAALERFKFRWGSEQGKVHVLNAAIALGQRFLHALHVARAQTTDGHPAISVLRHPIEHPFGVGPG